MKGSVGTNPDNYWSWTLLQTKYTPLIEDFFHPTDDYCLHTAHTIPSKETVNCLAGTSSSCRAAATALQIPQIHCWSSLGLPGSWGPVEEEIWPPPMHLFSFPTLWCFPLSPNMLLFWFCLPGPCVPMLNTKISACCTHSGAGRHGLFQGSLPTSAPQLPLVNANHFSISSTLLSDQVV